MEKRRALAGAGALTITALTGALAIGAAFGLIDLTDHPGTTGNLSPVDQVQMEAVPSPTPIVETIVVDVPAPAPKSAPRASVAATVPAAPQVVLVDPPAPTTERERENHESEHEDEDREDHEAEHDEDD